LFPLESYEKLVLALKKLPVNLQEIPKEVLTLIKKSKKEKEKRGKQMLDFSSIPTDIMESLLPFQMKGLEFALEHDGVHLITC
jgi:hypothetical protein